MELSKKEIQLSGGEKFANKADLFLTFKRKKEAESRAVRFLRYGKVYMHIHGEYVELNERNKHLEKYSSHIYLITKKSKS